MARLDGFRIQGNRIRAAVDHLRMRRRIGRIDIQVVTGDHIEVVPELLLEVLLLVHLRVQRLHHLDDGTCLLGPLRAVLDALHDLDHFQHVPPVLGHRQFLDFSIIIQLDGVLVRFHNLTLIFSKRTNIRNFEDKETKKSIYLHRF